MDEASEHRLSFSLVRLLYLFPDPYLSFAAWIAISMGAGLILSVFGGRAYMEFKHRKGRKELKQMIVEATENEERKDL